MRELPDGGGLTAAERCGCRQPYLPLTWCLLLDRGRSSVGTWPREGPTPRLGTADTYALHPLLAAGAANLAAAGISDPVGKALFDAGYAAEANFTAPCPAQLYVAVTRESVQAGQQRGGTAPLPGQPGWQAMAAGWIPPKAAPSTSSAKPSSSRSSPS